MGSKGELNHRPDDWADDRANDRPNDLIDHRPHHRSHHRSHCGRLVDHPGGDDSGADISAAHTTLLAVGEAIGMAVQRPAAEAIGSALKAAIG